MATPIIIFGESGTGKSYSLRNFKPGEIGVVNVLGKWYPFENQPKSIQTLDFGEVMNAISVTKSKSVVIDDAGYLITDMFMTRHSQAGGGNSVFQLYNDIGDAFYSLLRSIVTLPDTQDKLVYIIMHEQRGDDGKAHIKTIGKLLDEKVCIEGMCTLVFHACVKDNQYVFETNGDGIFKSSPGMFDDVVPNDLAAIDARIREFWKLPKLTTGNKQ